MNVFDALKDFFNAAEPERVGKKRKFLSDDLDDLFEDPDKERMRREAESNATEFTDKLRRVYR